MTDNQSVSGQIDHGKSTGIRHQSDMGEMMKLRLRAILAPLASALLICVATFNPSLVVAATATVDQLHNFDTAGQSPQGALVLGLDGALYGTTSAGGSSGKGTIYKITTTGTLTTLFTFNGVNGSTPIAGLTLGSDGNFYGTTESGGTNDRGVVFEFTPAGQYTVLFHFDDANGAYPRAAPMQTSDTRLFGVTGQGGTTGNGTVYRLTTGGVQQTLFSFDVSKGQNPNGSLILGSDGNFYGTTTVGGTAGLGTIFRMTTAGTVTTLFSFTDSAAHGANPQAALLQAADGNFYGTTENGGTNDAGTVFKMTSAGVVTTLASFGGANGDGPRCTLVTGSDGNFYGTTFDTVFRITPAGVLTTLHHFSGTGAGRPFTGLVRGVDGNFYGTTRDGGSAGKGTVFRLRPPPAAPTALSASASGAEVSLSWSPAAGAQTYSVYQGTAAGAQGVTPVQTGISGTQATVSGLTSGRYFFVVTAVSGNGESSRSNEASATVNVPAAYSFVPVTGATPGTVQTSNTITLSGMLDGSSLAVTVNGSAGASYSKNGGEFTSAPGSAANGDTFQLRVNAAAAAEGTTQATLNIGRSSGTFTVTTAASDTVPDSYSFAPTANANPNQTYTSQAITVSGINTATTISVSGDVGAAYSVNGGPFTVSPGQVSRGSTVRVRVQSSSGFEQTTQATLNIGGTTASYAVSTGQDTEPDRFTFTPVTGAAPGSVQPSNEITVSGLAANAAISIVGDPGSAYSRNGAVFTSVAGTVANGDRVRVQVQAGADGSVTTARLLIGSAQADFTVSAANGSSGGGGGGGGAMNFMLLAGLALLRLLRGSVRC